MRTRLGLVGMLIIVCSVVSQSNVCAESKEKLTEAGEKNQEASPSLDELRKQYLKSGVGAQQQWMEQQKKYQEQMNRQGSAQEQYEQMQKRGEAIQKHDEAMQERSELLQKKSEAEQEKQEEFLKRSEKLQDKTEEQARRYDHILETWEDQQQQYQVYLDQLKK